MPTTPTSPPPGEGVPTTEDAFVGSGTEPTEVMPATPPPADAVGAEPGAGGAVPPGEAPGAPGEAGDETPWYKTPLGIAGLILGGLLLVALLIWIFWGTGDDDDDADPGAARVVLETVDTSGAALDRGFVANVVGPAEAPDSFAWLQPQSVPGPEGIGSTTGDDGVITFEWAPAEDVADPAAWASTITLVESVPAGFTPPGPTVDCVLERPDQQNSTVTMNASADPPDATVDQLVAYTFPNHTFLPGDTVTCELVSGLPPETTTTSTTTTTTVPETTTTVETTVAPTTEAPTTAAPTTVAPTTPPTQPATVIEALEAAGDYGDFLALAAGVPAVVDLLDGSDPVTVFAPTDEALDGQTIDPEALEVFLLSHIVDGEALDAAAIFDGTRTEIETAHLVGPPGDTEPGVQPVDQDAGTVGGVEVIDPDLLADNGVAHGIDGLMPPAMP